MTDEPEQERSGLDPEVLLQSPRARWLLLAAGVLCVSVLSSLQLHELLGGRRRGPGYWEVFFRTVPVWSAWALVMFPLVRLASWLLAMLRSWLLFLLIELPISVAVASGFVALHVWIRTTFSSGRSTFGPGRELTFERAWTFRLTREMLIYWALLAIGGGVLAFLRARREERRAAELTLQAARLQADLSSAQLDTLRGQMHPHFLFNALHTVGGLVRAGDHDTALRTLSGIGELLRATLEQGDRQEVPLEEDLAVARRYLEIQRVRFGDRLAVDIDVPAELGRGWVPAMLLLPLVENAVQHGVAPRPEGGRVSVRAERAGDLLRIEVCDDGPGFTEELLGTLDAPTPPGEGRRRIGLANTRERVEVLYGERGRIVLRNAPGGGACVHLELPYEEERRG